MDGLLSQILAVSLVLLALAACVYGLRRQGSVVLKRFGGGTASEIAVLSRRVLTAQHTLFLVEVRGRTMLIATSPGQCQLVGAVEPAHEVRN